MHILQRGHQKCSRLAAARCTAVQDLELLRRQEDRLRLGGIDWDIWILNYRLLQQAQCQMKLFPYV